MRGARILAALRIEGGHVLSSYSDRTQPDAVRLVEELTLAGAHGVVLLEDGAGAGDVEATAGLVRQLRRRQPALQITAGGAIDTLDGLSRLLHAGANRVIVGTAAIAEPELLHQAAQRFGGGAVIASMEVRLERRRGEETVDISGERALLLDTETTGGWYRVYVRGSTATGRDAISWATECSEMGVGAVMVTSVDPSGAASNYDLELIGRMVESTTAEVLAAGPMPSADMAARLFTLASGAGIVVLDAAFRSPAEMRRLREELRGAGVLLENASRREQPRQG